MVYLSTRIILLNFILTFTVKEAFIFLPIYSRNIFAHQPWLSSQYPEDFDCEDFSVSLSRPLGMTVKKIKIGGNICVVVDRSTGASDKAGVRVGDQLIAVGNMFGDGIQSVSRSDENVIQWVEKQVRVAETSEIEMQFRRPRIPLKADGESEKASEKEILELWRTAFKDTVDQRSPTTDDVMREVVPEVFDALHPEMLEDWAQPLPPVNVSDAKK